MKRFQMIKTSSKHIQQFLSDFNHELFKGEQVFHISFIYKSDLASLKYLLPIVFLAFFPVFEILKRFESSPSAIILFLLLLVITVFAIGNELSKNANPNPGKGKPDGLITSHGIRIKNEFFPWKHVFDIKPKMSGGRPYLFFDLNTGHKDYQLNSYSVNHSYFTSEYVFIGGDYDVDQLLNNIMPYWEPESPKHQLIAFSNQLRDTYQLSESSSKKSVILKGAHQSFQLELRFDKELPVEHVTAELYLPKQISSYLKISMESGTTSILQAFTGKDIQIGHTHIDNHCLFESSHQSQLQELFTGHALSCFEQLVQLGTVNWRFGNPIKRKQLKTKPSVMEDEGVLDTGMLESSDTTIQEVDLPTYNRLQFTGVIDSRFRNDPKDIQTYIERFMEFNFILAEHLQGLKEE